MLSYNIRRQAKALNKCFPKSVLLKIFPWFMAGLFSVHTIKLLLADTFKMLYNSTMSQWTLKGVRKTTVHFCSMT